MDPIHGDSSSKHTYDEQEHPSLENKHEIEKVSPNSSSLSSDGESLGEDYFQVDAAELDKSLARSTEIAGDKLASQSKTENGKVTGINDDVGTNDNSDMLGQNHSPPPQVMERSDVPDLKRISSSGFTGTSPAMDWSMVSSESLFSIPIENSFSFRDHAFLMGRSLINFPTDPYLPSTAEPTNAAAMQGALRVNAEKVGSKDRHSSRDMHGPADIFNYFASRMATFLSSAFPLLTGGRSGSVKVEPMNQLPRFAQAEQHPPRSETTKAALQVCDQQYHEGCSAAHKVMF